MTPDAPSRRKYRNETVGRSGLTLVFVFSMCRNHKGGSLPGLLEEPDEGDRHFQIGPPLTCLLWAGERLRSPEGSSVPSRLVGVSGAPSQGATLHCPLPPLLSCDWPRAVTPCPHHPSDALSSILPNPSPHQEGASCSCPSRSDPCQATPSVLLQCEPLQALHEL